MRSHGRSPFFAAPPPPFPVHRQLLATIMQSSVDPKQAKSGLRGLYGALITSFTASTYQTAGQIALGLHVGTLLKVSEVLGCRVFRFDISFGPEVSNSCCVLL